MVNILRKGHVIVKVEEAVSSDAPVYVRYAAGGNGPGSIIFMRNRRTKGGI